MTFWGLRFAVSHEKPDAKGPYSLHSYLEKNFLMPSMQSSYRKDQSTETALLRVMNNISKERLSLIVRVNVVLNRTVVVDSD